MTFLINPFLGSGGPTYAEYQAHIAARATGGSKGFNTSSFGGGGTYRSTPPSSAVSGVMAGSSWSGRQFRDDGTNISRAVQHGMPDEATFNVVFGGRFEVLCVVIVPGGVTAPSAFTRNGFTSSFVANADMRLDELVYWDGTSAWSMNPYGGTGPAPYTW